MLNKESKKIILLPPKTGTQSLIRSFAKIIYKYKFFHGYTWQGNKLHGYLDEHIEHHKIKDIENWKIYQTARNPMNRVPSAFFAETRLKGWNLPEKKQSFEDFVKNIHNHKNFKDPSIATGMRFYVPQVSWADSSKYDVQYIKLEEDNSEIYADLGLPKEFERSVLNSNPYHDPYYDDMHTEETKKIIKSLYRDDFLKLNYE